MKKIIFILAFVLLAFAVIAQDEALTIDAAGNVGIGITEPQKKLDVNGDLNVSGKVFTNGIASLSASSVIEVNSDFTSILIGTSWTNTVSGQFDYSGGASIYMINYSLYSSNSLVYVNCRLKLTNTSTNEEIYLPNESGWVHHTNETTTHHHKSLDLYRSSLPSTGTWNATFQIIKNTTRAPNSTVYFNADDTMHVVVLELPTEN